MKIIIAKKAGFCFGVRRAVELAQQTLKRDKTVYSLGPIIHNPQEVKRLQKCGIKTLKSFNRIKNATIILRTHGVPLSLHKDLEKNKTVTIVDAICPFVKRAQNIVRDLADKNETIIIVGEKIHPEVIALISYGKQKCIVVENLKDAKKINVAASDLNIVSQTTQTPQNFNDVVNCLKQRYKTKVFNTICKSTFDIQSAAHKLAKVAGLMIVIGGKNSGNTTRLAQICKAQTKTHHIETARDIKKNWFKEVKVVGISAGASTPEWIINGVKKKIEETQNGKR